jgi:hypothetical protein
VRREQHGKAAGGEAPDLFQDAELIAEIEVRGGLVEDQQPRLLRKRALRAQAAARRR